MKRIIHTILFLFGFGYYLPAQNLVLNPSFEINAFNKIDFAKIHTTEVEGWGNYGNVILHTNAYCGGHPYQGYNYVEITVYATRGHTPSHKDYREYLSNRLLCPLLKDSIYRVSLKVLNIKSEYKTNTFSVVFSRTPFYPDSISPEQKIDSLLKIKVGSIEDNHLITDTGYFTISADYKAKGGEQYIILGITKKDKDLRVFRMRNPADGGGNDAIIYAIDYVEVVPLSGRSPCPILTEKSNSGLFQSEKMNLIDTISLGSIYFNYDQAETDSSLQAISQEINAQEGTKLLLMGYTDHSGTEDYNLNLSEKRAAFVAGLIRPHTDKEIIAVGKGKSVSLGNEKLERRVDVYLLK